MLISQLSAFIPLGLFSVLRLTSASPATLPRSIQLQQRGSQPLTLKVTSSDHLCKWGTADVALKGSDEEKAVDAEYDIDVVNHGGIHEFVSSGFTKLHYNMRTVLLSRKLDPGECIVFFTYEKEGGNPCGRSLSAMPDENATCISVAGDTVSAANGNDWLKNRQGQVEQTTGFNCFSFNVLP